MHQAKKRSDWHFAMEMPVGDTLALICSIDNNAAEVHDTVAAGKLLHDGEQSVFDWMTISIEKRHWVYR